MHLQSLWKVCISGAQFAGSCRVVTHITGQGDWSETCADARCHRSLPQDICRWSWSKSFRRKHPRLFWPIRKGIRHSFSCPLLAVIGNLFIAYSFCQKCQGLWNSYRVGDSLWNLCQKCAKFGSDRDYSLWAQFLYSHPNFEKRFIGKVDVLL